MRADHPQITFAISREQYEDLKHVNMQPPGRLRAGLFQALERQGLKREVAVSVTHLLAIPELIAATDYCSTLPKLICPHLARDPRLKIIPLPVEMAWHVRYRNNPAHRWLRSLSTEVASEVVAA